MSEEAFELALKLTNARKNAEAFETYPSKIPVSLDYSYEVQEAAIELWEDEIIGWKIGRLSPETQAVHATERLSGPIFKKRLVKNNPAGNDISVINGGFAAVEAEFVFEIKHDADKAKFNYTAEEAFALIGAVYCGVEIAGSPIFDINTYGPTVVASDFGNNFGLIIGKKLFDTREVSQLSDETCLQYSTNSIVNGANVGEGGLFSIPNGPLLAIAWLAGHLAQRNRPLKAGQFISSGATTGIHDVNIGDWAKVSFINSTEKAPNVRQTIVDEFLIRISSL